MSEIGGSRLWSRTSMQKGAGIWMGRISQQESDFTLSSTKIFLHCMFFPFRMDIQRSYSFVTWELYGDFYIR